MEIKALRNKIDMIDQEILACFQKRLQVVTTIAQYKEKHKLSPLEKSREREIINKLTVGRDDFLAGYIKVLWTTLFDISRSYQNGLLNSESSLVQEINQAVLNTASTFPENATVACQGIEGAYSQIACDRLFARPLIVYMNSFQDVFKAVDKGLCQYGVLPIENSLYGSVNEVYDLIRKYKFSIIKALKLKINHSLLAKGPIDMLAIKEIVSHQQGLGQCSDFINQLPRVKITAVANTALAARMVAESSRDDLAAISSQSCAELYNLSLIANNVQDNDNNYTRFICISKDLEIYPGAHKTSLMFTLPNRPGSLYNIISRFSALGLNLVKLESRPIPGTEFEFMFYLDLDAEISNQKTIQLLAELEKSPDVFVYLGSYSEV